MFRFIIYNLVSRRKYFRLIEKVGKKLRTFIIHFNVCLEFNLDLSLMCHSYEI